MGTMGDFKCVTQAADRLVGTFSNAEAEPVQQCLEECEVMDIQSIGAYYTWNNKQPPETRVYSKLDRLLVNYEWSIQFPEYYANVLPEGHFDHAPCSDCVRQVWNTHIEGTKMYGVVKKLNQLKAKLKKINKTYYSDVENQADVASTTLHHLQQKLALKLGDEDLVRQEYDSSLLSVSLQQAKMVFLKPKAKAHWIAEGDENSFYFHGVLKARKNKNFIHQIKDHKDTLY
ncbi:uncharacterized protein LOC141620368 [Silene latifolia]|uniref:uncharacterized protein LOC141620368 n=1 Tax=Silene latifolia TaxID=37657 RepID=UPI003D77634E